MSEQVEVSHKKPEVYLKDLKHDFVSFSRIKDEFQEKVMEDYKNGWKDPFNEETRLGLIKLPLDEEIPNRFHSELYDKHFPEGQMVLRAKIKGKWEPVMSVRSLIWMIPYREIIKTDELEGMELQGSIEGQMPEIRIEKIPDIYPDTWYKASGNGSGYPNIMMFDNGELKIYSETDYERVLHPKTKRKENEKHNLVLINYALTANRELPYKVKGAMKALVTQRGELAEKLGLGCDTYTPASGLAKYLSKLQISDEEFERYKELFVKRHINENMLMVAAKHENSDTKDAATYSDIKDAATMHLMQGANFVGYALNARHDPRSKGVCIITCYIE